MDTQPASLDPPDLELFAQLDGTPVPNSWKPLLATALLRLSERSALDRALLNHLTTNLRIHQKILQAWMAHRDRRGLNLNPGTQKTYPVATLLLDWVQSTEGFPGHDVLLAVLCEFSLRPEANTSRKRLAHLAATLSGSLHIEDSRTRLQAILLDAATVPEMQSRVEHHLETSPPLYRPFEDKWKSWLRDRLVGLILNDPAALRRALPLPALAPSLEAPELTVQANLLGDADDVTEIPTILTLALDPGEQERAPRVDVMRARAVGLVRASQGDLLAPLDQFVPDEIIAALACDAVRQAQALQVQGRADESESFVALALAIATGLRESDLVHVCWGEADPLHPTVHENQPSLARPINRPPHAIVPGPALVAWLEPWADHGLWPLPPSVHQLLLGLTSEPDRMGQHVLPKLAAAISPPYRLRELIKSMQPGLALGAGAVRQALAAHLARHLGPDVAQLALGDTFSMSATPTYYSALQHRALITTVRALHTTWFGESAPETLTADGTFGSRLVLMPDAARRWSTDLHHRRRTLAHRKNPSLIEVWSQHRDFLAAALCAVTGHRPVDAIGQIDLDQVIPEYGLIILRDKQIDPLRKVRIAATGSRWRTALRGFLDRLIAIAAQTDLPEAATLAMTILRSEAPLFSVPGTNGPMPLTAEGLRASMPEALRTVANHYRHRLNQQLQSRGVDPELRYAQLGWVVSPAHATADLSPLSARDLATELAPHLDDLLLQDGWFHASQRIAPWHWEGVPHRPLRDWATVAQVHEAEHRGEIQRLRQNLHERGKRTEQDILPRLAKAIRELLPSLRVNEATRTLERAPSPKDQPPVIITDDLWLLICDRVRQQDSQPAEAFEAAVTRILLHRMLTKSHKAGWTCGALPRRPIFSQTAEPSPFLPGSGLAVRHAEQMREIVRERVREGRAHDQGTLALLAVLLFSPYRDATWATAAVNAAAETRRSQAPGDCLRVPATLDHQSFPMAFSGMAALLLARRGRDAPKGRAPNTTAVYDWLLKQGPTPWISDIEHPDFETVVQTLRAAGRLELSGPERVLMLGPISLTGVSADRYHAGDDRWPVRTREDSELTPEEMPARPPAPQLAPFADTSTQTAIHQYRELTALLNPGLFPKILGKEGDGRHGWRGALAGQLDVLQERVGVTTTLGLIVGFALHRLRYGGLKRRLLEHSSLHTVVTRFARDLLQVVGSRNLLVMDSETLCQVYLAILLGKSPRARPLVLESLTYFQSYLEAAYQVDAVSFAEMVVLAGPRFHSVDPGLLTDPEVETVHDILCADLREEQNRTDASPDAVRVAELRLVLFDLLEASGARPGSVHGLTLGDVYVLGEGRDFIHLHQTGEYGSVKTITAVGFVPLEGALWTRARTWVTEWLARERTLLTGEAVWKTPLFAETPGSRSRLDKALLQRRLGSLIRWVTDERKAHLYWLRKRRVMARHRSASLPRAHAVYGAMCANGHALITTPLTSYICDPAIAMAHSLREGRSTSRADILSFAKLPAAPLDVAWLRRGGAQGDERLTIVFERLPFETVPPQTERYTTPPALLRQRRLLPMHIDAFARSMHQAQSVEQTALYSGLSLPQTERLQRAAAKLLLQRGQVPWPLPELQHPRAMMSPPRLLQGTHGMLGMLQQPPTLALQRLSVMWAAGGHWGRLAKTPAALHLSDEAHVALAREVLQMMAIPAAQITIEKDGGLWALRIDRPGADGREEPADRRTLSAALNWVLAMVWLQQQLVEAH